MTLIFIGLVFAIVGSAIVGGSENGDSAYGGVCLVGVGIIVLLMGAQDLEDQSKTAGAIAHASGKVTATRIDHGDRVEWKAERVKEPVP